jgi:hypothetical protein
MPFALAPDDNPATQVANVLNSRRSGQRYDHLVRFTGLMDNKNAWITLEDMPTTADELIDRFHRCHPRALRPPATALAVTSHSPSISTTPADTTLDTSSATAATAPSASASVPLTAPCAPTPLPKHQNLCANYVPPISTTTCTSRVSKPPVKYNPLIPVPKPRKRAHRPT